MDKTNYDFLQYSANENMKNLRTSFNKGENIIKETIEKISVKQALEDILYFQFVIENGYSGYGNWRKDEFDKAFIELKKVISSNSNKYLYIKEFLDTIKSHFSFIFDGHLAITTEEYGIGFYKALDTFVSSYFLKEHQDGFLISDTNQVLSFKDASIKIFPSIKNGERGYLVGVRSYNEVKNLEVFIDGQITKISLHKIKSSNYKKNKVEINIISDKVAYVKNSTFIGDNQNDLDTMYKIGKKLSNYSNVIWDLSNNMGGNAEFAKQFIKGLSGCCSDRNKIYQLQSTLVHAKETGQIQKIPYGLKEIKEFEKNQETNYFSGHLHIIINDSVASSAELAIDMTSCIDNRTVYGCNTLGIGRFGDLLIYYLPNSKATLWCPHKIYENGIEEGEGYEPDFWIDDTNTLKQILNIL